jgi:hypothetical protein
MALFASLLEGTVMRIVVAVCATPEPQPNITGRAIRPLRVTLLAVHGDVPACQRILRLRVVKGLVHFPIKGVMACFAAGPEFSTVLVLMAACAGLGEAEIGPVQVLCKNRRTLGGSNFFSVMATITRQVSVFAIQFVSGLCVIEGLRLPAHHLKVFAVMVGVALNARVARRTWGDETCMQTSPLLKPHGDLPMAVQAAEIGRA